MKTTIWFLMVALSVLALELVLKKRQHVYVYAPVKMRLKPGEKLPAF